ncbi:MAG: hypothetical protein MN733_40140, partial [Nitrososphaera sp.]|nr:hypothetical protein [Nitrososphaera sp.]
MASIQKIQVKGGVSYQLHYYLDGQRKTEYFPIGTDQSIVEARKKEIEAAIVEHKVRTKRFRLDLPSITLAELYEHIEKARKHDVNSLTVNRNMHSISLLIECLGGHRSVSDIRPKELAHFKRWRRYRAVIRQKKRGESIDDKLINRGINHDLAELRTVFEVAIQKGILKESQCPKITFVPRDRRELRGILTEQEVHAIASHVDHEALVALYLLYYTGANRREIVRQRHSDERGIRWRDIDFEHGKIRLFGDRRERIIPILPELAKILRAHKSQLAHYDPNDFVVSYIGDTLTKKFRGGIKKAGINKPGSVQVL